MLLEKGADFNAKRSDTGKFSAVTFLIGFKGNSPLHIGAINLNYDLLMLLCNRNHIDFMSKNKDDKTPIDLIRKDRELRIRMCKQLSGDIVSLIILKE